MTKKLSPSQQIILNLMQEGWELGVDTGGWRSMLGQRKARLQKNGLGKGGEAKYFKAVTVDALERQGYIKQLENKYPMINPTRYVLTDNNTKDLDSTDEDDKEAKYREFVLYFAEKDRQGIPWGMSDLREKAVEMQLPIPLRKTSDVEARKLVREMQDEWESRHP